MATKIESPEMGEETDHAHDNPNPSNPNAANPNPSDRSTGKPPRDQPRDEAEPVDPEEFKRVQVALKKANDEAKKHRLKAEEYERAEEEKRNANLGEAERVKQAAEKVRERAELAERRAEEAEREVDKLKLEALVVREAGRLGFKYPETAFKLIDQTRITRDEDDQWIGIPAALEKIGAQYPDLVNKKPANAGSSPRDPAPFQGRRSPAAPAAPSARDRDANPFEVIASELKHQRM